jgi:hypothetical protein
MTKQSLCYSPSSPAEITFIINLLNTKGNYMNHLLEQSVIMHFAHSVYSRVL